METPDDSIDYYVWLDDDIRLTFRCDKRDGPFVSERANTRPLIEDAHLMGRCIAIQSPGDVPATVIRAHKLANAFGLGVVNWLLPTPTSPSNR